MFVIGSYFLAERMRKSRTRPRVAASRNGATHQPRVGGELVGEGGEGGGVDLLRPVAQSGVGVGSHLDDDAVGSDRRGGA